MAFVLQTDYLCVGVALHQPGEQRRPVFTVAVRISYHLLGIEIFLIAELFFVGLVFESRLHEMQQHADKLRRGVVFLHLVEGVKKHFLRLDRQRRGEINREHRHRDVVEVSDVRFVVRQRYRLVFRELQLAVHVTLAHVEVPREVQRHLAFRRILLAEAVRINRLVGLAAAVHAVVFHLVAFVVVVEAEESVGIHLFAVVESYQKREVARVFTATDTCLEAAFVTQHVKTEHHAVVDVRKHLFRKGAEQTEIAPFVESELVDDAFDLAPQGLCLVLAFCHFFEVFRHVFLVDAAAFYPQLRVEMQVHLTAVEIQQKVVAVVDSEFFRPLHITHRHVFHAFLIDAHTLLVTVVVLLLYRHRRGMCHLRQLHLFGILNLFRRKLFFVVIHRRYRHFRRFRLVHLDLIFRKIVEKLPLFCHEIGKFGILFVDIVLHVLAHLLHILLIRIDALLILFSLRFEIFLILIILRIYRKTDEHQNQSKK